MGVGEKEASVLGWGWGTAEMFTKPSQIPGRRSVRSLEVLEFGAGRRRERKKIRKETRKIGVVEGEPGVQVRRESGTTGVLESGDLKEKN